MASCMKRRTATCSLALAVLILISAIGCGGSAGADPESTAKAFLDALIEKDAPGSYELLSERFTGEYGVAAVTWNGIVTMSPIPDGASYVVKKTRVDGESAVVAIEAGGEENRVGLIKEAGDWKVDYELGSWYGLETR